MADIKRTFSLGGGSAASSLRSVLREFTDSINQSINSIASTVSSRAGSSSTTFNQPSVAPSVSTSPNNPMTGQQGGGGGANTRFGLTRNQWENVGHGVMLFRQAMPSVPQGVEQNIMATRAGFYGFGTGTKDARYDSQQVFATNMMRTGSGINPLDASRAMMLGQSNGIGMGLSNYNQLSMSVSKMSNLNPGAGIEGSMQAMIAQQQPRTVNAMKFMGIMARDPQTGKPVPPEQIAQQLWNKISRERRADMGPITKDALATSLLPGGALDSLLNQVTGGDQMLRQQLETYFYAKASGAKNTSKSELTRVGLRTDVENATAKSNAEQFRGVAQTSRSSAAGVEMGTQFATAVEAFGNWVDRLTGYQKLGTFGNGFLDTAGSALNGVAGNLGMMGLLKFLLPGKAAGGQVGAQNAYIVGEKGPELFLPDNNGTIVPNNQINFAGFREKGGDVTARDFSNGILGGLGITPNSANTKALETWMRFEGGHFKNSATYNPLNTTLDMPGSHSMNKVGVEAYTSFDQGIQATIKSLTGSKAGSRGYTAIVDALRSGSEADILDAINNSAWRTGKTGGAGAYKFGKGSNSAPTSTADTAQQVANSQTVMEQMVAAAALKSTKGTTFAAGAIVININGAGDASAVGTSVVDELKKLAGS